MLPLVFDVLLATAGSYQTFRVFAEKRYASEAFDMLSAARDPKHAFMIASSPDVLGNDEAYKLVFFQSRDETAFKLAVEVFGDEEAFSIAKCCTHKTAFEFAAKVCGDDRTFELAAMKCGGVESARKLASDVLGARRAKAAEEAYLAKQEKNRHIPLKAEGVRQ